MRAASLLLVGILCAVQADAARVVKTFSRSGDRYCEDGVCIALRPYAYRQNNEECDRTYHGQRCYREGLCTFHPDEPCDEETCPWEDEEECECLVQPYCPTCLRREIPCYTDTDRVNQYDSNTKYPTKNDITWMHELDVPN